MSYLLLLFAISGLQEWENHLLDMDIAAAEEEVQVILAEDSLNTDAITAGIITTLIDSESITIDELDSLYSDLLSILESDTSSVFVLTALGYLHAYRDGVSDASYYYSEKAFSIDSTFIFARFGFGSEMVLRGYEEKGMSIIDSDLRLSSSLLVAYFKTIYLKAQEGRKEELLEVYRIAFENYPDDFAIFSGYVAELYLTGRESKAESTFYEQIGPDNLEPEEALYLLANVYAENGCWNGAIVCYETLISIDSDNDNYLVEIAYCFEMTDNLDAAREMYIEALRIDAQSGFTNYYLGVLEFSAGNREIATDYVIRAAIYDPLFAYDVFDLALTYENDEDIESLVYLLQKALGVDTLVSYAEDQLGINVNILLAENLQYLDKYEDALDIYYGIIGEDSTLASVWRCIGLAHEILDGNDRAVLAYTEAIENISSHETPWFYGQLGYLMEDGKDTDAALAYYTEAVTIESLYNYGWMRIGILTVQTGEYRTALDALERALETGSDTLSCMAGRILSFEGLGRDANAEELETEFLSKYPTGWIDFVYFNFHKGDSMSLAIAERVKEDAEEDILLLYELAYLYDYLEVPFGADSCFMIAIHLDHGNTKVLNSYAEYLSDNNRDEEAIEMHMMISEIDSLDSENWNVLGEKLLFSDRLAEAENAFLTSLSIEPGQVWVLAYLGYLYELREDIDRALDYYFATLDVSPGYEYAEGRISSLTDPYYSTPGGLASSDNLYAQVSFYSNVEIGDTRKKNYNIGCDIEYDFDDRGSNIELALDYTLIESTREWVDNTNWTNIKISSARHVTGDFSLVLSSEWDRQPNTCRPWQITSSFSGAYGRWVADWFFIYPEAGLGLVNTHWRRWNGLKYEDERTDIATAFGSFFLQFVNYDKNWPTLMLYGDFYIPPGDTDGLITNSFAELSLDVWDPVSFTIGYDLDYTRTPTYEFWDKYDTNFYMRFNVRIF